MSISTGCSLSQNFVFHPFGSIFHFHSGPRLVYLAPRAVVDLGCCAQAGCRAGVRAGVVPSVQGQTSRCVSCSELSFLRLLLVLLGESLFPPIRSCERATPTPSECSSVHQDSSPVLTTPGRVQPSFQIFFQWMFNTTQEHDSKLTNSPLSFSSPLSSFCQNAHMCV